MRVAMLGFWHVHADDYAGEAQGHPDVEIVGAWDEDPTRGAAGAADLGVPYHADLAELLARPDVDGVIVTTRTTAHRDVIIAAAEAGKHVFTEKVLALTPTEAREIVDAVDRRAVKLVVSLPRLSHGYTLAIREILGSGRLGEVTQVRVRLSHDGAVGRRWLPARFFEPEEAGGGALVDLGCHPLYLTRLFLGVMPESISAEFGRVTGQAVDDNSVAIMRSPSGAIGIAETGFVNPASPFTVEIHGTEGSLLYGTPEAKLLISAGSRGDDMRWEELPIPASAPSPFEQWVGHVADGSDATENVALALDLTSLVDAAGRSAAGATAVAIGAHP
jgi:predicted dehydrogenase